MGPSPWTTAVSGPVRRGGPARRWDGVAEHIARRRGDGSPELDRFEVTVTAVGQPVPWSRV